MKNAFKKGFGAILGVYCGLLAVSVFEAIMKPENAESEPNKEESETKDEEAN